jgi:hypothetical protein
MEIIRLVKLLKEAVVQIDDKIYLIRRDKIIRMYQDIWNYLNKLVSYIGFKLIWRIEALDRFAKSIKTVLISNFHTLLANNMILPS